MISAQPVKQTQERLIVKFMEMPNIAWDDIMQQARSNVDVLNTPDNIKILGNVLKTNVAACSSIGQGYFVQLGKIYFDLMGLYKAVSGLVSDIVAQQGKMPTLITRSLRTSLTHFHRSHCCQDTKSSRSSNNQKGSLEINRHLC
jgi:exportin-1